MDPMTGQLVTMEELTRMEEELRNKFVPIPGDLQECAGRLIAFRDAKRKELNRKRNRMAKTSRRRNRGK